MKFIITEQEKQRILEMHRRAIRIEFLNEQGDDDMELYEKANVQSTTPVTADMIENGNVYTTLTDKNGMTLYYTCIRDPRVSKADADSDTTYNAGHLHDAFGTDKKNNTLLVSPYYEQIAQGNCRAAYSWLNSWRYENCPKLNANTHWDYSYQCSSTMAAFKRGEEQAAAAEVAAKEKAAADAAAAKEKEASDARDLERNTERQQTSTSGQSFADPFNKLYNDLFTKVSSSPMGTQQEIEDLINQLNTMMTDPNLRLARYNAKDLGLTTSSLKNIPKLIQTAKTTYPNISATFTSN